MKKTTKRTVWHAIKTKRDVRTCFTKLSFSLIPSTGAMNRLLRSWEHLVRAEQLYCHVKSFFQFVPTSANTKKNSHKLRSL